MVTIINSGLSKTPRFMDLLRFLVILSMKHNFYVRARHVPRIVNAIADALSRFHDTLFQAGSRIRTSGWSPPRRRAPPVPSRLLSWFSKGRGPPLCYLGIGMVNQLHLQFQGEAFPSILPYEQTFLSWPWLLKERITLSSG